MKHICSFFRGGAALFKKDIKLYGVKIISTLLLLILIVAAAASALFAVMQSNMSSGEGILHMAVYDREPSALTNTAIKSVAKMDTVKEFMTVEICDSEEDVRSGIKDGTYDAALIFEEGYYTKILGGNDSAVKVLLSSKLETTAEIVRHFAVTGEKLIEMAEAGVEGAYQPLRVSYSHTEAREMINAMEINYALKLFAIPSSGFDIETVSYSSAGVGEAAYYIICFVSFLMLVCEVVFFPYTSGDCTPSMLRRIKSYRINGAAMVAEKAVIPFLLRALLLFAAIMLAGNYTDIDLSAFAVLQALLCIFLLSVFLSAVSVLLSQSRLGISVIFALSAVCLVLSGGLIPLSMLPYEVRIIGSYTPLGACAHMLSPLFCGDSSVKSAVYLTLLTAFAVAAAVFYMRRISNKGGEAK